MASFRAGSFDFVVVSAHVRWGTSGRERIPELELLARWVGQRSQDPHSPTRI